MQARYFFEGFNGSLEPCIQFHDLILRSFRTLTRHVDAHRNARPVEAEATPSLVYRFPDIL